MNISNSQSTETKRREGTLARAVKENPGLTRPMVERWMKSERIWSRVVPDVTRNKYRVDLDEVAKVWASEKRPEPTKEVSEAAGSPAAEQVNGPASVNRRPQESEYPDQPLGLPNGDRFPGGLVKAKANNPVKRAKDSMRRMTPRELLRMKFWIENRLLGPDEHPLGVGVAKGPNRG